MSSGSPYQPGQPQPGQPQPGSTQPAATQTIVLPARKPLLGPLGKVALVMLGIAVMFIFGQAAMYASYMGDGTGPQEKFDSLSKTATQKIAVIEVSGTIMEGDNFAKKQIDKVLKDDDVIGAVLRINSPGGTVTYSDYLLHHLKELRAAKTAATGKEFPLVVSMGSLCASGGYYIAMAVEDQPDAIFAERTTWTGSIGVIIPNYNITKMMKSIGVDETSIASGEFKQMGSPTSEMTEEERELFQTLVDETFEGFKQVIYDGRPAFAEAPEKLDPLAKGQIFTADQALEAGLVDKIGFKEDAIERAAELAGLSTDDVRCVRYAKTPAPLDALLGASAVETLRPQSNLRAMLELSAPRAYMLYSTWPALLRSH